MKGMLREGTPDAVARRWRHNVELWKHPKVCFSSLLVDLIIQLMS